VKVTKYKSLISRFKHAQKRHSALNYLYKPLTISAGCLQSRQSSLHLCWYFWVGRNCLFYV